PPPAELHPAPPHRTPGPLPPRRGARDFTRRHARPRPAVHAPGPVGLSLGLLPAAIPHRGRGAGTQRRGQLVQRRIPGPGHLPRGRGRLPGSGVRGDLHLPVLRHHRRGAVPLRGEPRGHRLPHRVDDRRRLSRLDRAGHLPLRGPGHARVLLRLDRHLPGRRGTRRPQRAGLGRSRRPARPCGRPRGAHRQPGRRRLIPPAGPSPQSTPPQQPQGPGGGRGGALLVGGITFAIVFLMIVGLTVAYLVVRTSTSGPVGGGAATSESVTTGPASSGTTEPEETTTSEAT